MPPKTKSAEIRQFIIDNVDEHPRDIVRLACERFGISRQAIGRHITTLVEDELIVARGNTRQREYSLKVRSVDREMRLADGGDEYTEWRDHVSPLLSDIPENVLRICNHGFTEILNNAIDHSEGELVTFRAEATAKSVTISIRDDGVGIFEKIRKQFDFEDHRRAVMELAKGKLTTDSRRHSGQGIFFTSRMFDTFIINSGTIAFLHAAMGDDWLTEVHSEPVDGTVVLMEISAQSARTSKEVFDQFSDLESGDYDFSKTHFPLSLARSGKDYLVSRSQAKRVLARFEDFKEVLLDFGGIDEIGQAFADEIFRVYQREHPEVKIEPMRANEGIRKMINRAKSAK